MLSKEDVNELFITEHVGQHHVALDVGAHHGLYTCILADICRHVVAFEPNPAFLNVLRQRTQLQSNVTIALFQSTCGSKSFQIDDRPEWGGVASSLEDIPLPLDQVYWIEVACVSLDEYCLVNKLQPGFIKIDAEGHETRVFSGAQKTIAECRPFMIFEFWESWWGRGMAGVFQQLHES